MLDAWENAGAGKKYKEETKGTKNLLFYSINNIA
jgi:hypothetical protein